MKTARTLAAALAVSALALTGCSQPPSAAAVVDGVQIPVGQVQQAGQALQGAGMDAAQSSRRAAIDLTIGEASRHIAADRGIAISQADKDQALAGDPATAAIASTPEGRAWGDAIATTFLTMNKLGQDEYLNAIRDVDITVNPRYGSWSSQEPTFTDGALSRPANPAPGQR